MLKCLMYLLQSAAQAAAVSCKAAAFPSSKLNDGRMLMPGLVLLFA